MCVSEGACLEAVEGKQCCQRYPCRLVKVTNSMPSIHLVQAQLLSYAVHLRRIHPPSFEAIACCINLSLGRFRSPK